MICCFSGQSLLHPSPSIPLCAFLLSLSKGSDKQSFSLQEEFFVGQVLLFLSHINFFAGIQLFTMPVLVVFAFFQSPTSKRSLCGGARCQDRKCLRVLSASFFFQVCSCTQYKTDGYVKQMAGMMCAFLFLPKWREFYAGACSFL